MMFFKLTQAHPGGLTRRTSFDSQPNWLTLAAKIEALFGIPPAKVAVAYVDADGDEVTISSNEELHDFYLHSNTGSTVKLTIVRLPEGKSGDTAVPRVSSSLHGTDIDVGDRASSPETVILGAQDWDPLHHRGAGKTPVLPVFENGGIPAPMMRSLYAFVPGEGLVNVAGSTVGSEAHIEEVPSTVPSKAQSFGSDASRSDIDEHFEEARADPRPQSSNFRRDEKGKSREVSIVDLGEDSRSEGTEKAPWTFERSQNFTTHNTSMVSNFGSPVPDPPEMAVPSHHSPTPAVSASAQRASLYTDIAGIMGSLSNIMNNALHGSYDLNNHIERAINDAGIAAGDAANRAAQAATEEAARKLAETLQSVLSSIGTSIPAASSSGTAASPLGANQWSQAPPVTANTNRSHSNSPLSRQGKPRPWSVQYQRSSDFVDGVRSPPMHTPPHEKLQGEGQTRPQFSPPLMHLAGPPFGRPGHHSGPHPPAPPPRLPAGPPPPTPPPHYHHAPPPPPPEAPPLRPISVAATMPGSSMSRYQTPPDRMPEQLMAHPPPPPHQPSDPERERLEQAKNIYKQEKAAYRAQREAEREARALRKKRHERGDPQLAELTTALESALGSGGSPTTPSATGPISAHSRTTSGASDLKRSTTWESRPAAPAQLWSRPSMRGPHHDMSERIIRRLADMGFTLDSHPNIPAIVRQQTRHNLSKTDEEIVERVLEVLIGTGTKPSPAPAAGPSRWRGTK